MHKYSKQSLEKLTTAAKPLQKLFLKAIEGSQDITILAGARGQAEQDRAFNEGRSHVKWPSSRHNHFPSFAIDCAPYPIDWNNIESFKALSIHIFSCWDSLSNEDKEGYDLVWGGSWIHFKDYPHWEIIKK